MKKVLQLGLLEQAAVLSQHRSRCAVHFSSHSEEWPTPQWFFGVLNEEFHFTLDQCPTHDIAKRDLYFIKAEDGLGKDWANHRVFMNLPYGREFSRWTKKAYESEESGSTVVCLVPARTDTLWWHAHAMQREVRFIQGRLKFGNSLTSAPFPSPW